MDRAAVETLVKTGTRSPVLQTRRAATSTSRSRLMSLAGRRRTSPSTSVRRQQAQQQFHAPAPASSADRLEDVVRRRDDGAGGDPRAAQDARLLRRGHASSAASRPSCSVPLPVPATTMPIPMRAGSVDGCCRRRRHGEVTIATRGGRAGATRAGRAPRQLAKGRHSVSTPSWTTPIGPGIARAEGVDTARCAACARPTRRGSSGQHGQPRPARRDAAPPAPRRRCSAARRRKQRRRRPHRRRQLTTGLSGASALQQGGRSPRAYRCRG